MPVSEETFKQISIEDPDGHWELHDGCLLQKDAMSVEHNQAGFLVGHFLAEQLDLERYMVRVEAGLIRRSETRYYIPDVMVVATEDVNRLFPEPGMWEVYPEPVLLVVEVWSPSTGRIDVTDKLDEYRRRGDRESWHLHPYEHSLTAWRRQSDGSYTETIHRSGRVEPASLPGVSLDLDRLFRLLRPRPGSSAL